MVRVNVSPTMLRWARERAQLEVGALAARFPKLDAWERGEAQPTLKQLEDFARATHAPVGYLFLARPPEEPLPIPDFRTMGGTRVERPSPDLLDTIYLCERRQDWYREFARTTGEAAVAFVGSAKVADGVEGTAAAMRKVLAFDVEERRRWPTWEEALRRFIERADDAGVLVMCSGIVLSNTSRKLSPEEFRGFAMADDLAPLVFINGADSKSAQMFTLAHELAHIWLGQSALSDAQAGGVPENRVERWCNKVAAELLVPLDVLQAEYHRQAPLREEISRLKQIFKVSSLVILRRMHDAGGLTRDQLSAAYGAELVRLRNLPTRTGGDFYLALGARASKRLARALVASTLEGRTSFTEAFRLLGLRSMSSFDRLGERLGMQV